MKSITQGERGLKGREQKAAGDGKGKEGKQRKNKNENRRNGWYAAGQRKI